jgi:hypothetical protein
MPQRHSFNDNTRHAFRHVYSPGTDRMPRWVWRLWAWF